MNEELKDKAVLAMYDVRGIQSYIFKTNRVKEIVGASNLVEGLISNGLEEYVRKNNLPTDKYILDWKSNKSEVPFLVDATVHMEIMFIGGGNAYVLFRSRLECQRANHFLAKYVLEHTYSLSLAVAVVDPIDLSEKDSYKKNYDKIHEKLREVKGYMVGAQPMGALPFMMADSVTGYPITKYDMEEGYLCRESVLKKDKAFDVDDAGQHIPIGEKIFDDMITEKGDNSSLALCHIDGNSMGIRIRKEMQNVSSYEEAIPKMRRLSQEIATTFESVFNDMCEYIDDKLSSKIKNMPPGKHLYRRIILAGDDITFVCNAKAAIPAVKYFLEKLRKKEGGYSACAGIAIFNSHFPFSDAYKVAEACCESAKQRAKDPDNKTSDETTGCFFDFQICTNISAAALEAYREKNYSTNGELFIARPYWVFEDDRELIEKNTKYNADMLDKWLDFFTDRKEIARNKAKDLRNIIPQGIHELDKELSFLQSRDIDLEKDKADFRIWYDALEIMDLHIRKETPNEDKD